MEQEKPQSDEMAILIADYFKTSHGESSFLKIASELKLYIDIFYVVKLLESAEIERLDDYISHFTDISNNCDKELLYELRFYLMTQSALRNDLINGRKFYKKIDELGTIPNPQKHRQKFMLMFNEKGTNESVRKLCGDYLNYCTTTLKEKVLNFLYESPNLSRYLKFPVVESNILKKRVSDGIRYSHLKNCGQKQGETVKVVSLMTCQHTHDFKPFKIIPDDFNFEVVSDTTKSQVTCVQFFKSGVCVAFSDGRIGWAEFSSGTFDIVVRETGPIELLEICEPFLAYKIGGYVRVVSCTVGGTKLIFEKDVRNANVQQLVFVNKTVDLGILAESEFVIYNIFNRETILTIEKVIGVVSLHDTRESVIVYKTSMSRLVSEFSRYKLIDDEKLGIFVKTVLNSSLVVSEDNKYFIKTTDGDNFANVAKDTILSGGKRCVFMQNTRKDVFAVDEKQRTRQLGSCGEIVVAGTNGDVFVGIAKGEVIVAWKKKWKYRIDWSLILEFSHPQLLNEGERTVKQGDESIGQLKERVSGMEKVTVERNEEVQIVTEKVGLKEGIQHNAGSRNEHKNLSNSLANQISINQLATPSTPTVVLTNQTPGGVVIQKEPQVEVKPDTLKIVAPPSKNLPQTVVNETLSHSNKIESVAPQKREPSLPVVPLSSQMPVITIGNVELKVSNNPIAKIPNNIHMVYYDSTKGFLVVESTQKDFYLYKTNDSQYESIVLTQPQCISFSAHPISCEDVSVSITANCGYALFGLKHHCELYRCSSSKRISTFGDSPNDAITAFSVFPKDNNFILVGNSKGEVLVYLANKKFQVFKSGVLKGGAVVSVAYLPQQNNAPCQFFVATESGRIYLMTFRKEKGIQLLQRHPTLRERIKRIFTVKEGGVLYAIGENKVFKITTDRMTSESKSFENIKDAALNDKKQILVMDKNGMYIIDGEFAEMKKCCMTRGIGDITSITGEREAFLIGTNRGEVYRTFVE
ncbi:hypothetical protein EIN_341310 [Entamoeba invadens IP1]|uniref:Uncharacterized protein n=1 Tax=Entamoeba invadens IP1 TaxID=370355 RepID=A0A0A1UGC0_ENTIV|nr:hypothetical protein EIN_341310 [Entamoeba invadens IP1]ELP94753.1 hypothetical protein EIN_341310 [Entamoeba invadens IP1]|eukprot:XP_004261524.1 hypothetical protein EIN_341310 [Entamoeba invadens IP1]